MEVVSTRCTARSWPVEGHVSSKCLSSEQDPGARKLAAQFWHRAAGNHSGEGTAVEDWTDDDWMQWIENTFDALDTKDVDAFVAKLTPGAEVRFGNGEPVVGRVAIRDAFRDFLDALGSVSHAYTAQLKVDDTLIVEAMVTATRRDGATVVIPSATVFELIEGKAERMQTYIDASPLFAAGETPALCRAGETVMA